MKFVAPLVLLAVLAAEEPKFAVQSRLVLVPVTVTDGKGRAVEDLDTADFLLSDNGKQQTVAVDSFTTGVAPLALVVAVQSSGISAAALAKVQKIGSMIKPLITGVRGCAALVAFAERVQWLQECTASEDALGLAFGLLKPGEDKAAHMLDAVQEAIVHLAKRPNARRVLFVISESRDRGSETSLESVLMAAQASGVTIYALTYSAFKTAFTVKPSDRDSSRPVEKAPLPSKHPQTSPTYANIPLPPPEQRLDILGGVNEILRLGKTNTTKVLASSTGGTTISFNRQSSLENAIEKLGTELHTQYVLSFVPEVPVPGYHELAVRIARSGDFRIRTRPGYWSAGGK